MTNTTCIKAVQSSKNLEVKNQNFDTSVLNTCIEAVQFSKDLQVSDGTRISMNVLISDTCTLSTCF